MPCQCKWGNYPTVFRCVKSSMEPFPAKFVWRLSNTKRAKMRRVWPARAVWGCDPLSTKVMAAPNQVLVIITPRRISTALKEKFKEELIKLVDETITQLRSNHKISGLGQLLVFSVTPFKIDQNKNQNRSTNKVQNLGNERRYTYKDPRQDSGQRNIS